MLFDVHHFSYFTSRFDIILLSLVPDTRYFAWFIIYLDSSLVIFYDFNCRFVGCKVPGAEIYAP